VVYTYALLVIDKAMLDKAQPADQTVVREVMDRIYASFDADSKAENDGAMKALTANNIRIVEPESGAVRQWRGRVLANNLSNAEAGMIPLSLYQDMLATLDEYRSGQAEKTAAEIRVD
jgi:TRAP-type C4-dicarboxylate transport system substrate-binding protein